MPYGIQGVMNWQTWRTEVSSADTGITTFEPADLSGAKSISVTPYTAIILLPLVVGDAVVADTVDVKIIGYMGEQANHSAGPGQALWFATLKVPAASAVSMSSAIPLSDGKWVSRNWTFFEDADFTSKYDEVSSVEIGGTVSKQLSILLPTVGYTTLMMEITNLTGTNPVFGCMWRGVSKEGAI